MGYDMWGVMFICWLGIIGFGRCFLGLYWMCLGGSIMGVFIVGGWLIICWLGYILGCIFFCSGCFVVVLGFGCLVIGFCFCWVVFLLFIFVMLWILDFCLFLLMEFNFMKYFWVWFVICVGVFEIIKFWDILC